MGPTLVPLTTLPIAIYGWALANPGAARSLVAELKRRWRLHLVDKYGGRTAQAFFSQLRTRAAQEDIDQELVEEFIKKHQQELAERSGIREANARLGEPTPFERSN